MGNPMQQQMGQMNPQMGQMNPQMMGQQSQMGNPMQQQMGQMNPQMGQMNPQMLGNDMQQQMMQQQMMQQQMMQQQMMQQQMMQQQMMQQQMMAQAQAQAQQAAMQSILNQNGTGTGQGNTAPANNMPSSAPSPGGGISVIFRASGATGQASAPIMVQCMPDEKVSQVIEKYRSKSGDKDDSKKFIFNAKNLAPGLTVAEAGITNNANIFVVATKGIKGAF